MKNTNNLISYFIEKDYSANKIQKYLQNGELGIRRQILLKKIREIKGITINEERLKILHTPTKYLSPQQKDKKYSLLFDKMRSKAYRREQREKRTQVKEFMQTDSMDEDSTLTDGEKGEDAYNEMCRYLKYELYEMEIKK